MLYLDHCATTPPYPDVIDTVADVMRRFYGNPSSIHRIGMEAENLLKKAREVVAGSIHCKPEEIIFTSGGSESNNLAIKGVCYLNRQRGMHLVTTQIEHASVYETFRQLERDGFKVTYLPVDATGAVDPGDVERALTHDTILVSIMLVNNETGRIQPVEEIGKRLRSYPKVLFHVDAVQALGHMPVDPKQWGADLASFSGHKVRGPKGTGFLYKREHLRLSPLIAGGGQEMGYRSGTENVPLLVGMAKAVRRAVQEQPANCEQLRRLRARLIERLNPLADSYGLAATGTADPDGMAPHIVHVTVPGIKPEVVVHALEEHDIYISTRSACASREEKPSRVLQAMGLPPERAQGGLRISFSSEQTVEDMDRFADTLAHVLAGVARQRR